MNRRALPLVIGSLLVPLGWGCNDPAGPGFDPLVIAAPTLPPAVPTLAYSVTLTATGGDGNYTWSVISGSTPGGLTLAANGDITGTPTGSSSTFTVQVVSGDGQTASQVFTISVNDVLTVTTVSLPSGFTNTTYDETVEALGGAGLYMWSLAVGAPPTGLSIETSTGSISGTPTGVETQNFTVEVSSGDGQTAQQALSITVLASPAQVAVSVGDNFFDPASQGVAVGGTVTWTWTGQVGHNVTFPSGTNSATQTSGMFARVFANAGSFDYLCTIHGSAMSGTIVVEAEADFRERLEQLPAPRHRR